MLPANLSPVGERVLVDIESLNETTTSTGIIVLERNKTEVTGTVLAVGAGARTKDGILIPMSLKVGDVILFSKAVLQEVTINNKKFGIVKESDIYGVVN